jgi:hypothetical protein
VHYGEKPIVIPLQKYVKQLGNLIKRNASVVFPQESSSTEKEAVNRLVEEILNLDYVGCLSRLLLNIDDKLARLYGFRASGNYRLCDLKRFVIKNILC